MRLFLAEREVEIIAFVLHNQTKHNDGIGLTDRIGVVCVRDLVKKLRKYLGRTEFQEPKP